MIQTKRFFQQGLRCMAPVDRYGHVSQILLFPVRRRYWRCSQRSAGFRGNGSPAVFAPSCAATSPGMRLWSDTATTPYHTAPHKPDRHLRARPVHTQQHQWLAAGALRPPNDNGFGMIHATEDDGVNEICHRQHQQYQSPARHAWY